MPNTDNAVVDLTINTEHYKQYLILLNILNAKVKLQNKDKETKVSIKHGGQKSLFSLFALSGGAYDSFYTTDQSLSIVENHSNTLIDSFGGVSGNAYNSIEIYDM